MTRLRYWGKDLRFTSHFDPEQARWASIQKNGLNSLDIQWRLETIQYTYEGYQRNIGLLNFINNSAKLVYFHFVHFRVYIWILEYILVFEEYIVFHSQIAFFVHLLSSSFVYLNLFMFEPPSWHCGEVKKRSLFGISIRKTSDEVILEFDVLY